MVDCNPPELKNKDVAVICLLYLVALGAAWLFQHLFSWSIKWTEEKDAKRQEQGIQNYV